MNRKTILILACVILAAGISQSCIGAGDMFAEKRTVVGDYVLIIGEGDQPTYFLFRRGGSGSITGPLRAIGWDQHFILAKDDGPPVHWVVFAINPNGIKPQLKRQKAASWSLG